MDLIAADSHPSPALRRRLPWDFHPALSEDRLRLCARLLANARRDALALAAYEMRRQLVGGMPGLLLRAATPEAGGRGW